MVSLLYPDTKPQLGLHFNFKSPHFSCLSTARVTCAVSFGGTTVCLLELKAFLISLILFVLVWSELMWLHAKICRCVNDDIVDLQMLQLRLINQDLSQFLWFLIVVSD